MFLSYRTSFFVFLFLVVTMFSSYRTWRQQFAHNTPHHPKGKGGIADVSFCPFYQTGSQSPKMPQSSVATAADIEKRMGGGGKGEEGRGWG